MNLNKFSLAKYKFSIKPKEKLKLPSYKGSTLRGGFGSVLKDITCINKKSECKKCILGEKCVYSYVFETSPPVLSKKLRKLKDIPYKYDKQLTDWKILEI